MKVTMKLVFIDKFITRFMQDADVFEKFKVAVAGVLNIEMETLGDDQNNDSLMKDLLQRAKNFCEKEKFELIGLVAANGFTWFDETVKVVSDGETWLAVENYIEILKRGSDWPRRM